MGDTDIAATAQGGRASKARVLAVVTSHDRLGDTGYPTGLWLSELAHPYLALLRAGYEVDVASPAGGQPPIDAYSDPNSEVAQSPEDFVSSGFLANEVSRAKLDATRRVADIDPEVYDGVFFAGGYGAAFDLRDNPEVRRIAQGLWELGGVVGALCHGVPALFELQDADGGSLVEGQKMTGFSTTEEHAVEQQIGASFMPYFVEDALTNMGADYDAEPPFQPHAVTSGGGRLVTGQQQFSGEVFGNALVEALDRRA